MFLVNPCEVPLTRNSYDDKTAIVVADDVEYGETQIGIAYSEEGIEIFSEDAHKHEDKAYEYREDRVPEGSFISSVMPGESGGLFNRGEDYDEDPLIWAATPTLMIANGMPVEMSVIYLDEGLLVCLQRGAIQVQVNDDGDTQTLTRGLKHGISEDQKFMSASESNFAGMPTFAKDSILAVTLKRGIKQVKKDTYSSLETSVKVHREASALLDLESKFLQEEMARQEKAEAEAREAAIREEEELEALARKREEAEAEIEKATKRERAKSSTSTKSTTSRSSNSGRSAGAAAFLAGTGIKR